MIKTTPSDFRLQTSDFRPQTSDFRPQTSDFRPQTSDFRLHFRLRFYFVLLTQEILEEIFM